MAGFSFEACGTFHCVMCRILVSSPARDLTRAPCIEFLTSGPGGKFLKTLDRVVDHVSIELKYHFQHIVFSHLF